MGIEYVAVIAEHHYYAFKILVTTTLPRDYEMWLRVRERKSESHPGVFCGPGRG